MTEIAAIGHNRAPSTLPKTLIDAVPSSLDAVSALRAAGAALVTMHAETMQAANESPQQLARAFVVWKKLKEKLEELEKDFNKLYEPLKTEKVPQAFELAGIENVPLSEGFRVSPSTSIRASIRADKKADAFEWLRANGLGELITEQVNAQTLSSVARGMMEDENKELPEAIFNVAPMSNTSVTKIKAKGD